MQKLNATGVKTLKVFHLFFVIVWLGGGISLTTILFVSQAVSFDEFYMKFQILKHIDDYIIITGGITTLIIGLIYGIWTKWGFFKHNWITVKWVVTVLQALFGTFFLGPWVNGTVNMLETQNVAVLSDETFLKNIELAKNWGTLQAALLIVMVVVSVFKPFKRKKTS
jgi:uncharacterized membrane protein